MRPHREDVLEKLDDAKPQLEAEFGVETIELFGSIATGEQTDESDVDLLISFRGVPTLFEMGRLKKRLEEILSREVDIVTPEGLRERTLAYARRDSIPV